MDRDPQGRGKGRSSAVATQPRSGEGEEARQAKQKLEALFGGEAPAGGGDSRRPERGERVFSSPRRSSGRQPSSYRLSLERLRMAREPEEIRAATDQFLKQHQLPDEVDILFKVLQHPEERVLRDAMGQLSALLMQGRLNSTLALMELLREIEGRLQEEATRSYVNGLRSQIAAVTKK